MVRFWFFGLRSRSGTYLESIACLNINPEVLTRFLVGRFSSDPFTSFIRSAASTLQGQVRALGAGFVSPSLTLTGYHHLLPDFFLPYNPSFQKSQEHIFLISSPLNASHLPSLQCQIRNPKRLAKQQRCQKRTDRRLFQCSNCAILSLISLLICIILSSMPALLPSCMSACIMWSTLSAPCSLSKMIPPPLTVSFSHRPTNSIRSLAMTFRLVPRNGISFV